MNHEFTEQDLNLILNSLEQTKRALAAVPITDRPYEDKQQSLHEVDEVIEKVRFLKKELKADF